MLEVEQLRNKTEELSKKLTSLQSQANSREYIETSIEYAKLSEILAIMQRLENLKKQLKQTTQLLSDAELKEIAQEEVASLEEEIQKDELLLGNMTRKGLPDDDKKAIVEIRPGVGGIEAALFAEDLYRMYLRYCSQMGFKVVLYSTSYENEGGIKEAVFLIDKSGSFGHFRFESGVHRVQRVPITEAAGRIHTSTASVVVMPEQPDINIEIKPEDLRIDVYRSSGPGGQSVNTTDSAVRITHIPSGIVVTCQEGKSQHKNKEIALSILKSKLYEIEQSKKEKEEKQLRELSIQGGARSSKIRTYNFPQGRVTDHRINKSWFNISEIMNGGIDGVVGETSSTLRDRIQDSIDN